ncbi:FliH/SctL family protein [Microbulbifer sp. SSSA008]|uniref:FliH/SctL family protein n=1 Tax=Microbulbifer sp. SSSA008 TaxID=3243380 RepID=UPI0040393DBD
MSDIIRRPKIGGTHKIEFYTPDANPVVTEDTDAKVENIQAQFEHEKKLTKSLKQEILTLQELISRQNSELENLRSNLLDLEKTYDLTKNEYAEDIESKLKQGYADGWKQAEDEYKQHFTNEAAKKSEEFEKNLELLGELSKSQWLKVTESLSLLALEVSCKILGVEYAKQSGLRAFISNVIEALPNEKKLTIKASPLDVDRIRSIRSEIEHTLNCEISLIPDDDLRLSDLLIEYDVGVLDGGLERQLMAIRESLSQEFNCEQS